MKRDKNLIVVPIESPWFAVHLIRSVLAGYLSWYLYTEGENLWGTAAAVWVVIDLLTAFEVRDRRKAH